ncbi:hypothetical protein FQR65_LT15433 [Abscondita terminalis]|nr:hypothetical protein FQR65_LT15433 [Abscondita terminalis]
MPEHPPPSTPTRKPGSLPKSLVACLAQVEALIIKTKMLIRKMSQQKGDYRRRKEEQLKAGAIERLLLCLQAE